VQIRGAGFAILAFAAIVAAWLLGSQKGDDDSVPEPARSADSMKRDPAWPRSIAALALEDGESVQTNRAGSGMTNSSFLDRISEGFTFTPEQLAEYLRRNGTNAESLLVAAQLGTNRTEFLKLAAQLFPGDPRVQFAVVAHEVFPEQKREWLERFKQSAPDNALAAFLSAREYAKAGDRTAAIRELLDASGRQHFNDYTLDRWQTSEEAQLQAGRPIAEAKASSAWGILLPHLAQLKGLSIEMETWQKEYRAAGDNASAENLAQMGAVLARHLMDGEGSHFLINQLVGVAVERKSLSQLPPDSHPEFLRGTVQERLDELTRFREESKRLVHVFNDMIARDDEAAIISFYDRMKVQGEHATLTWLKQKIQPAGSPAAK
jgi:hypothetical protein